MGSQLGGQMDRQIDGQVDRWTDRWTDRGVKGKKNGRQKCLYLRKIFDFHFSWIFSKIPYISLTAERRHGLQKGTPLGTQHYFQSSTTLLKSTRKVSNTPLSYDLMIVGCLWGTRSSLKISLVLKVFVCSFVLLCFLLFWFVLFFRDRVSLYSPSSPGTHSEVRLALNSELRLPLPPECQDDRRLV